MGKSPEGVTLATDAAALHFLRTASKDSLVEALDITPTVAARILDLRTTCGFASIDDVKKLAMRKRELLALQDALGYAASRIDLGDDYNTPQFPATDSDPTPFIKQRGAFSEKALNKAQRPCPRRVDCHRYGR
ncbi:hypothetical protein H310_12786 [Aphanomyces invadans]|uniref:Uncharacterized protein n=1 Tax=Aphanomyces invadans TaxID=157072 RepID=A0A024TG90_9STRA|nr:hypothetical protein H310_12786 [Aphanomyces invadans]ETV93180.1 hypothetical protein H310_12786 [Aphanomyces invadans]RHY30207.1 hypothetical protein DYB32_004531 [Aphanomyces invadans]|eukprot:XP_008878202.1 hypothetical protein H310_12786 [Aphanomyces invadans]